MSRSRPQHQDVARNQLLKRQKINPYFATLSKVSCVFCHLYGVATLDNHTRISCPEIILLTDQARIKVSAAIRNMNHLPLPGSRCYSCWIPKHYLGSHQMKPNFVYYYMIVLYILLAIEVPSCQPNLRKRLGDWYEMTLTGSYSLIEMGLLERLSYEPARRFTKRPYPFYIETTSLISAILATLCFLQHYGQLWMVRAGDRVVNQTRQSNLKTLYSGNLFHAKQTHHSTSPIHSYQPLLIAWPSTMTSFQLRLSRSKCPLASRSMSSSNFYSNETLALQYAPNGRLTLRPARSAFGAAK